MTSDDMTMLLDIELQLQGVSISDGIAIGQIVVLEELEPAELPKFSISKREVDHEIQRYRQAITSSREDLFRLQDALAQEGSVEAVTIIDAHIQMLQDPFMTTMIEERISERLQNTESVFQHAIKEYEDQFARVSSSFFKQRLKDVKDLSSRILKHLSPQSKLVFDHLPSNSILIAKELVLSDAAEAPKDKVSAFLSHLGSSTSHAALIARAKGIPYVSSIDIGLLARHKNAQVIVDGKQGIVILRPSKKTLEKYENAQKRYQEKLLFFSKNICDQARTRDGHKIEVHANIEHIDDVEKLKKLKADGIGLFRSEYLFFDHVIKDFSEESQYRIYRNLFKRTQGMRVVFRVFDIGGDKAVFQERIQETNPALGCRSIRFLLRHRDIFRIQLRALMRAAINADVQILLPLITDLSELLEVKRYIRLIYDDLETTGYRIKKRLQIGSMIEVPSAVVMSEWIAKESDFLSIGTNDLIQYTLAADRLNASIADMYQPAHPSIIRMLSFVAQSAKLQKCPLSICGEMASSPLFTALLIGLGITKLSCSPRFIPIIKHTVCHTNMVSAQQLAKEALNLGTSHEIHQLLTDYYCEHHKEALD